MQANSIWFEVNSILAYSIDFIRFKSYSKQVASTDSIAVMIHFMPTNSIKVENHSKLEQIQNFIQLLFSKVFLSLTVHFFLFEFLLDSIRVEIYFVQANSMYSLWVEIEICSRLATSIDSIGVMGYSIQVCSIDFIRVEIQFRQNPLAIPTETA